MKIVMLKNAFKPNDSAKARTILKRNTIHDLKDVDAKALIEKEYAAELKPEKPDLSPFDQRKAEVKALGAPALQEVLTSHGLEDEKNNNLRKAKILEVEFKEDETKRTEDEIAEFVAALTPAA